MTIKANARQFRHALTLLADLWTGPATVLDVARAAQALAAFAGDVE